MADKYHKNIRPTELLDLVLTYFLDGSETFPCRSAEQILYHLKQKGARIDIHDIDAINIKLKKDGYLSDDKELAKGMMYNGIKLEEMKDPIWFLTFEGRVLLELEGGYKGKKDRERILEERVAKNERSIRLFTKWAGIGTVGLLLLEVIKYIVSYYM
jgi:hypothetical protein